MKTPDLWDSIKGSVAFALMIVVILMGAYVFARNLAIKIEQKRTLDSLRMENLKLDIELKKHKLGIE